MSWLMVDEFFSQVEEDEKPLSQVFGLGISSSQQPQVQAKHDSPQEQAKHEQPREQANQEQPPEHAKQEQPAIAETTLNYGNLLYSLHERVEAVDASLATAVTEIAHILSVLGEAKMRLARVAGVPKREIADGPIVASMHAGELPSPAQKPPVHAESVREGMACVGSPCKSSKRPASHTTGTPGATFSDPLEVQDDASSHSVDSVEGDAFRVRQRVSVAKRVHYNPRQRVVPCAMRCGASRPLKQSANAVLDSGAENRVQNTKYKDPPGYDDATDFGRTSGPKYTGPPLEPRSNSVSFMHPIEAFNFWFASCIPQLTGGHCGGDRFL